MPRPLYIAVIAAIILVAGVALLFLTQPQQPGRGTETAPTTPPTTETTREEQTPPAPPTAEGGVVQLTLYLNDYGYNASRGGPTITVYVNDLVRITLVGNGSGPIVHDFALDSGSPSPYEVKSNRLSRGQTQVIEFVASYPGEYKYYCSVAPPFGPSHRERGQEGTIIILPKS